MQDQVKYYDDFGKLYEESIVTCSEPELWTTDYDLKGRIYQEIKTRVEQQKRLILETFSKEHPVLDLGCGFGRQSFWLAKMGFTVIGTDTSGIFINIARKLFDRHGLKGNFIHMNLLHEDLPGQFKQVVLFDVIEHIRLSKRKIMIKRIADLMEKDGMLLVSVPPVRNRLSSWVNNNIRKMISSRFRYFLEREEHPYPIPGKKQLVYLTQGLFALVTFKHTVTTDFYLFRSK